MRSEWPSIAAPCVLLVQFLQVLSSPAAKAVPSACDPVSTSWRFGVSPRPLMTSPFSLSAVCLVRLLAAPCRSATSLAITAPLAFCHGPLPMRSRALTAGLPSAAWVERYARQVLLPAPPAWASFWHCASAPSRPPRSAPLPGPLEVTKNVMSADCACADGAASKAAASARPEIVTVLSMRIILSSLCVVVGRQISTRRSPAYSDAAMRDPQKKKAPCKKHDALVFMSSAICWSAGSPTIPRRRPDVGQRSRLRWPRPAARCRRQLHRYCGRASCR